METWYRASFGIVEEVLVERVTEHCVILPNQQIFPKDSNWRWFRQSRDEAKAVMVEHYEFERNSYLKILRDAQEKLVRALMA